MGAVHRSTISSDTRGRVESPYRSAGARKLYAKNRARLPKKVKELDKEELLGQVMQERQSVPCNSGLPREILLSRQYRVPGSSDVPGNILQVEIRPQEPVNQPKVFGPS